MPKFEGKNFEVVDGLVVGIDTIWDSDEAAPECFACGQLFMPLNNGNGCPSCGSMLCLACCEGRV